MPRSNETIHHMYTHDLVMFVCFALITPVAMTARADPLRKP